MKTLTLPQPTPFGAYWFGKKGHGPAILPSKWLLYAGKIASDGKFIASLDDERGFLFEGTRLKRFGTVLEAFRAIQQGR